MELRGEAKLLRIFLGEDDKVGHGPLHEAVVKEARAAGLAGATAWKGMLGFGATSRVRTTSILDLSSDLPVIVEIVDGETKIDAFLPTLQALFEKADSGGLVTIEKVQVLRYLHRKNEKVK
jgi:PII-like signaling protein